MPDKEATGCQLIVGGQTRSLNAVKAGVYMQGGAASAPQSGAAAAAAVGSAAVRHHPAPEPPRWVGFLNSERRSSAVYCSVGPHVTSFLQGFLASYDKILPVAWVVIETFHTVSPCMPTHQTLAQATRGRRAAATGRYPEPRSRQLLHSA